MPRVERLLLLGPPRWCGGGADADWPLPPERPYQLLVYLAHQGDWVGRERVAALFWPDHPPEAARANVRKLVFRLRALPAPGSPGGLPTLQERGSMLRWPVATDLQVFEQALSAGDAAAALAAWRGEPWAGLGAEDVGTLGEWLAFERERLRTRCLSLPQALADAAWQAQARARGLLDGEAQAVALVPAPLPAAVDPGFVGRRAELRQIADLLERAEPRWITLHGPGGIGKTRLLRAALEDRAHAQVVAFDDIGDVAAAWARLAEATGLRPRAETPLPGQLARHLGPERRWLGLDNLEQIPAFATALAPVLAACPGLRVLATSRARLGVAREWLLPLLGLPWPGPDDAERAEAFDAVRLFVQRARAHEPRFDAAGQQAAIVQLCAAVEGLPLALEMTAAWTRHFRVEAIVADLARHAPEMLAAPDSAAGGGLQACFQQSWQRLEAPAHQALAALALFRGGCTREAARAVAGATLPMLVALHDQSLLRRDETEAERWSLHPLLREYARSQLVADAVAFERARRAYAEYHLRCLAHVPPGARYAERYAAVQALLPDADNLQAAWQLAVQQGRADLLAAALRSLGAVMFRLARWQTLHDLMVAARPLLQHDAAALAVIDARCALADFSLGRFEQAAERGRSALRTLRRLGDPALHRETLSYLGWSLRQLGRLEGARHCFAQGLALARGDGDSVFAAVFHGGLAELAEHHGQYDQSVEHNRQSLALRHDFSHEIAMRLGNLGLALRAAGRLDEAATTLAQALAACGPSTGPLVRPHVLLGLAALARQRGDAAGAALRVDEATAALPEGGAPSLASSIRLLRAQLALDRGERDEAARHLAEATRDALLRRDPGLQAECCLAWGEWLVQAGRTAEAASALATAMAQVQLSHALRERGRAALAGLAGLQTAANAAEPVVLLQQWLHGLATPAPA